MEMGRDRLRYQMVLAWGMAAVVYQWVDSSAWGYKMGISDMIIAAVIPGWAGWLLYHSLWKNKGHCCGGCCGGSCGAESRHSKRTPRSTSGR